MVPPTILLVGATGNTGRSVVQTLPKLIANTPLSDHRILALTRSESKAAELKKVPGVDSEVINWIEITKEWLRERNVVRAFVATHNEPGQFIYESSLLVAALKSGVEYVVRISTTAAAITADCETFYPRGHWALEAMLSAPEFDKLRWTSLQPNIFTSFHYLTPAAELIKEFRKTGKQTKLRLMAAEDAPVGAIDPWDVGVFAAHLLAEPDTSVHDRAKYVLNGPEDITGRDIVNMVEKEIGEKVQDVSFKDMTYVDEIADTYPGVKSIILSMKHAQEAAWEGKASVATTSKEFLQIAPPKGRAEDMLQTLLKN